MSSLTSFEAVQNLGDDPDFVTAFNYLLQTETATDVTFILKMLEDETEIRAHQMVLAMRSPKFADIFYGSQKLKKCQTVRLRNINHKAFKSMIRYCYGCKPGLRRTEDVCELLKVAHEFEVTPLKHSCRTFLRDTEIQPENVFAILDASEKTEDRSLRDKCIKILQEKTTEVFASHKMCDVTSSMVHAVISLTKLSLDSEYKLIQWVFNWMTVKSDNKDGNFENGRACLQDMLQYLNFLSLAFKEFAELCKDYPDFLSSDEIASIFMNIAYPESRKMPGWYNKDLTIRIYSGLEKS